MFEKNQLAPIRMDLPFMYLVSEMTLQSQLTRSNCSRRGVTRAFFNSNETALRWRAQILVLRVFGSLRIWLATPELFVATRRRYVLRVFPSYASGVSQSF